MTVTRSARVSVLAPTYSCTMRNPTKDLSVGLRRKVLNAISSPLERLSDCYCTSDHKSVSRHGQVIYGYAVKSRLVHPIYHTRIRLTRGDPAIMSPPPLFKRHRMECLIRSRERNSRDTPQ